MHKYFIIIVIFEKKKKSGIECQLLLNNLNRNFLFISSTRSSLKYTVYDDLYTVKKNIVYRYLWTIRAIKYQYDW